MADPWEENLVVEDAPPWEQDLVVDRTQVTPPMTAYERASLDTSQPRPDISGARETEQEKAAQIQAALGAPAAALNAAGRGVRNVLGAQALAAIGQPTMAAQQLGVPASLLQKFGAVTEPEDTGETPIEQGIRSLPIVPRVASQAVFSTVEQLPKLAATAAMPEAAGAIFGITPSGTVDIKQAAIAELLPIVGKWFGAATEAVASKLGVTTDEAGMLVNKLGGAGGAAGILGADQLYEISKLPEDQRKDAYVNAVANTVSMAGLGMMGGREPRAKINYPTGAQLRQPAPRGVVTSVGTEAAPVAAETAPAAPAKSDFDRYQELVTKFKAAPVAEKFEIQKEIEAIKNRNGGMPPKAEAEPTAAAASPNDFTPALKPAEGEPIAGQQGQVHEDIYKAQEAKDKMAGLELRLSKPEHGFIYKGKFISREEASKLLGEKEPLQSERLRELQKPDETTPPTAKAEPAKPTAPTPQRFTLQSDPSRTDGVIEGEGGQITLRATTTQEPDGTHSVSDLMAFVPPGILTSDVAPRVSIKLSEKITGKTPQEARQKAYQALTDEINKGNFDIFKQKAEPPKALPAPTPEKQAAAPDVLKTAEGDVTTQSPGEEQVTEELVRRQTGFERQLETIIAKLPDSLKQQARREMKEANSAPLPERQGEEGPSDKSQRVLERWIKEAKDNESRPGLSTKVPSFQILAKRLLSLPYEQRSSGYGSGNQELRQDVIEAITGTRPPKSKAGAKATQAALANFFGIDTSQLAGIDIERAILEKLDQASKGKTAAAEVTTAPTVKPAVAKVEKQVQNVAATSGQAPAKQVKTQLVQRIEDEINDVINKAGLTVTQDPDNPARWTITRKDGGGSVMEVEQSDEGFSAAIRGDFLGGKETIKGKTIEDLLFKAKALSSRGSGKVTIEIPGDGTFTVWRDGTNLLELWRKAKRVSTEPTGEAANVRGKTGAIDDEEMADQATNATKAYGSVEAAYRAAKRQTEALQSQEPPPESKDREDWNKQISRGQRLQEAIYNQSNAAKLEAQAEKAREAVATYKEGAKSFEDEIARIEKVKRKTQTHKDDLEDLKRRYAQNQEFIKANESKAAEWEQQAAKEKAALEGTPEPAAPTTTAPTPRGKVISREKTGPNKERIVIQTASGQQTFEATPEEIDKIASDFAKPTDAPARGIGQQNRSKWSSATEGPPTTGESGFINLAPVKELLDKLPQHIVEHGRRIFSAVKSFGDWAKEMVGKFGESARYYLGAIWSSLKSAGEQFSLKIPEMSEAQKWHLATDKRRIALWNEFDQSNESPTRLGNYKRELIDDLFDDSQFKRQFLKPDANNPWAPLTEWTRDRVSNLLTVGEHVGGKAKAALEYIRRNHTDLWDVSNRYRDAMASDWEKNMRAFATAKLMEGDRDAHEVAAILDDWRDSIYEVRDADPGLAQFIDSNLFHGTGEHWMSEEGERGLYAAPKIEPKPRGVGGGPVKGKGQEAFISLAPLKDLVDWLTPHAKDALRSVREVAHEAQNLTRMTDYRRAVLNWSGKLQRSFGEAAEAQRDITRAVKDPIRREGITNWIQADGDPNVLAQRRADTEAWRDPTTGKPHPQAKRLIAGYDAALALTPEEITVANDVRDTYRDLGRRGQHYDVLNTFKPNYVTQVWNLKKGPRGTGSSRTLRDRFKFSKASTFDTFFDGEQAGYVPKTKDISKLLPVYIHEMNSVIAARQMVEEMSGGVASDGRPLVAARGVGVPVTDPAGNPSATLVMPKAIKGDTKDYRTMPNQPALNDWRWASQDTDGNPVFLKSDLALHPEAYDRIKSVLGRSAIREWYDTRTTATAQIPKMLVKGLDFANSETKRTMLGLLAPFHQVQEGTHAIGHRINPFWNIPKIDLVHDVGQRKAARDGLMLRPDRASAGQFMEGFRTSGLVSKIPGIGAAADWYSHYLFYEYIPGLKYKTYRAMVGRNTKVYARDLAAGRVSAEDISTLSAEQANAAYGHLNYADLGRNPTIQHLGQIFLLAPDFLESRARFAGQAIKGTTGAKVGREQFLALGTLAIAQAATAYTAAKLTGGTWDKTRPFEFTLGRRRYTMRSVPEDISSLMHDARLYAHSRLSPIIGKGALQYASGVDWRGKKVSAGQTTKELALQPVPISIRGFLGIGNSSLTGLEQLAGSVGLKISRYNPDQAKIDAAMKIKDWSDNLAGQLRRLPVSQRYKFLNEQAKKDGLTPGERYKAITELRKRGAFSHPPPKD
jgi:hypothetical protein